MITSLLIANRGEIACRIIRTARKMGIRTVAVYSDADAKALHVRQADEAVHIGPSPANESYLCGDKIIAAALETGAQGVHPGYGFLSENAEFAQAVIDAGLIWVGPKPASISAMGLKDAAKKLMADAGVPVTPGYMGDNQEPAHLAEEAANIGYPVLIKAVAGGGGKGMRLVEAPQDFADALISCQREAQSSFGNAHVLIEKYIQKPRHIEVQIFGDSLGNVVHLFERDCSLQRRHQKVIEEAPAPGMDEGTREALCAAAIRAAKAVNYENAGTIEFIADASEGLRADRIWFMEMNTRLQVEHPVTEEITGVDLVEWQLRVASGAPIPLKQEEISINGWAMEARLYAEDPRRGFLPSIGTLDELLQVRAEPGIIDVRYDLGYESGDAVSPYYDPMLGKIICHGKDRANAAEQLRTSCLLTAVYPVKNNLAFVARCLADKAFLAGDVDTGFIAARASVLAEPPLPLDLMAANAAADLFDDVTLYPTEPWLMPGFRLNAPARVHAIVTDGAGERYEIDLLEKLSQLLDGSYGDEEVVVSFEGERVGFRRYEPRGMGISSASDGAILSPMPGKIIAVEVSEGQQVTKGQKLLTLEAMKMEHTLTAPFAGVVADLNAESGAQVQVDSLLARIAPAEG